MTWNQEGFAEKSFVEYARPMQPAEVDYADPRFYEVRQEGRETPHSIPVPRQQARPSPEYNAIYPPVSTSAEATRMSEYRGPASLENYTEDVGAEQREAAKNGQVDAANRKRKRLAGLGGLGALLAGLLLKFQALLVVLFDIKWVAFLGKFGLASISALISVAVYSRLFGWAFAIGLVALLFVHEMGHAVVMKLKGIPVGGMIFIPMLGAAVFMRRVPRGAKDDAEVGIAGPLAGFLASLACLLIAYSSTSSSGLPGIWAPLAYFGFFLNLFNLIPLMPFDGGRVLAAIDRRVWVVGFAGLIAIQIWQWLTGSSSIWLLIFIVIAATDFWTRRHARKSPEAQAYYAVPLSERIIIGLAYFVLAAALVLGMAAAHSLMLFPQ